jgi:hypothetical protein
MSFLASHRPRSATEILDASIQLYRRSFVLMFGIYAVAVLPPQLLGLVLPTALKGVTDLVAGLLMAVAHGAAAVAVRAHLEGTSLGIGEAYGKLEGRIGSLIGVQILVGLAVLLGLAFLVVPGVLAFIWFAVAPPACALEQLGVTDSMGRSRELARGQGKHIFGTMFFTWLVVFVALFAVAVGLGIVQGIVLGENDRLSDAIGQIVFAVLVPLVGIVSTMLYFDLRVRREGADIEALSSQIGAPAPSGARV